MKLTEILETSSVRYQGRIAVKQANKYVTYADLKERVNEIGAVLQRWGVMPRRRVALYLSNGIDFIAAYFAVQQREAVAVLVPSSYRSWELAGLIRKCETDFIIYDADHQDFVKQSSTTLCHGWCNKIAVGICSGMPGGPTFQKVAVIIPTSGTSGRTKGVMLSADALVANSSAYGRDLMLTQRDRCLVTLPLTSGFAHTTQMLAHLQTGGMLDIAPQPFIGRLFLQMVMNRRPSITGLVPSQLRQILDLGHVLPEGVLARLVLAGEPCPQSLIDRAARQLPRTSIIKAYGLTEAGPRVCHLHVDEDSREGGCVGKPLSGIQIRVVNEALVDVPARHEGNVLVRSPSLMLGYYNDPELTKYSLKAGWLRTGDIGRMDTEGNLYITGRKRNLINKAGVKISAEELEDFLVGLDGVKEAHVSSERDLRSGEKIIAHLVRKPRERIELDQIILKCRQQLSACKVPDVIRFVKRIPRNSQGKAFRFQPLRGLSESSFRLEKARKPDNASNELVPRILG